MLLSFRRYAFFDDQYLLLKYNVYNVKIIQVYRKKINKLKND